MMHQIGIGFAGKNNRVLRGDQVTSRGLHGVLFHVLQQYDPKGASWLHQHKAPKPYSLAPYYDIETAALAGIRLNALTEQAAELLYHSWEAIRRYGRSLQLGNQSFNVTGLTLIPGPTFETLAASPPETEVKLQFLSPTAFKQGAGFLPLPLPANVFRGPFLVWQKYAPTSLKPPGDWLDWCAERVYVTDLQIETVTVSLSRQAPAFRGFVGQVAFTAQSDALLYLSLWQGVSGLAPYTGIGYKTTMGMGTVAPG